jgi:hypothetical protein
MPKFSTLGGAEEYLLRVEAQSKLLARERASVIDQIGKMKAGAVKRIPARAASAKGGKVTPDEGGGEQRE